MAIGQVAGWQNVSIAASAVNAVGNVASGVEDTINQMNTLADMLGKGIVTQAQFQAMLMKYQITLDMLKKLMDAITQAAINFHQN